MKGDICLVPNCDKSVRTGKVCETHGWRMRKHGSYEKPCRKRFGTICRVEGCTKKRDGKHSVCGMHRSRLSRYKSLEVPIFNYPEGIVHECKIHGLLTPEKAYQNPKYGHYSCIACRRENDRKFSLDNPEIDKNAYKNHYYVGKEKIKVSKEDYDKMLSDQNGVCAICHQPETSIHSKKKYGNPIRRLAIDHCHSTKKIRGLLCQMCNQGLGYFKDSIELFNSAIQYLKQHQ